MTRRPHSLIERLLLLHRERDPHALLHCMVQPLAPDHGRAFACAYLLDDDGAELRVLALADSAGELTPQTWRSELRAPMALAYHTIAPTLATFGAAVEVIEQIPGALVEVLPDYTVSALQELLPLQRAAVAPVTIDGATVGVLIAGATDGWPSATLGELSAHAAIALGNLHERGSLTRATAAMFMRSVIEQVAAREINRAERYGRPLSLAVIEVPAELASSDRLLGLATLVARVMRQPDTAGQLDERRMVVLLPETTADGAEAFLRRLREQAPADLASVQAACVTYPQDGHSWTGIMQSAFVRLAHANTPSRPGAAASIDALTFMRHVPPQSLSTRIPGSILKDDLPPDAPDDGPDPRIAMFPSTRVLVAITPAAATLRIQVTPIPAEDVAQWQALLMRLPSVATIRQTSFDSRTATFDLGVPSVASVLGQLRNLATKMDAALNIAVSGEVGFTLRSRPARVTQLASAATERV